MNFKEYLETKINEPDKTGFVIIDGKKFPFEGKRFMNGIDNYNIPNEHIQNVAKAILKSSKITQIKKWADETSPTGKEYKKQLQFLKKLAKGNIGADKYLLPKSLFSKVEEN